MSRRHNLPTVLGSLGMMVFFGCLTIYGEARDSPSWLVWPAFVTMLVLLPVGWYAEWRRRRRRNGS